jgi:hypothetical protein
VATASNDKQGSGSVTVVVSAAPAVVAAPAPAPAVSAGLSQTISLPNTTATVAASAACANGAKITKAVWQQSAGPITATIASPSSLLTKIISLKAAGTYVFRVTVTDENGKQAASVVDVIVKPAAASTPAAAGAGKTNAAPPTVSAGKGQAIRMPESSVMLKGVATGNGGSTIKGLTWKQVSGPATTKIGSPASISTEVSGLTAAGNYVFQLAATATNGAQGSGSMTVTVEAAAAKEPPVVSAGGNLTVTLPTSTATLKGVATGRNGAVVNSYFWTQLSGPSYVKFSDEWESATTISGLVAGTYVFQLSASDNEYETSVSSMTLVVKPKPVAASTAGAAQAGNASAITDALVADPIDHTAGLIIYPNPVHGLLNIHLNNEATGKIIVAVFNMKGARVQNLELDKGGWSLETSVDVSRLPAGVYVVEVISGPNLRTTQPFIKQ